MPVALVFLGTCILGAREAQESAFLFGEDVMANGGDWGRSSGFIVQDVIGQSFVPGTFSTVEFHESAGFMETLTASLLDPLDINGDGAVNAGDFFVFSAGWLRTRGEAGYRSRADFDENLVINRYDLDRYLLHLKERL